MDIIVDNNSILWLNEKRVEKHRKHRFEIEGKLKNQANFFASKFSIKSNNGL